jgi:hypothetical protein
MNDDRLSKLARQQAPEPRSTRDNALLAAAREQAGLNRQRLATTKPIAPIAEALAWWRRPMWLGSGSLLSALFVLMLITGQEKALPPQESAPVSAAPQAAAAPAPAPAPTPASASAGEDAKPLVRVGSANVSKSAPKVAAKLPPTAAPTAAKVPVITESVADSPKSDTPDKAVLARPDQASMRQQEARADSSLREALVKDATVVAAPSVAAAPMARSAPMGAAAPSAARAKALDLPKEYQACVNALNAVSITARVRENIATTRLVEHCLREAKEQRWTLDIEWLTPWTATENPVKP